MTTNQTMDEIKQELQQTANKDVTIKINCDIDTSVAFLDVMIINVDGQLKTTIYHKPVAEPYVSPFTSEHARHIYRNVPYGTLLRALRICSHRDDFHSELVRIDVSLLLNGYPPNFITKQFHRLFYSNNTMFMSKPTNEQVYHHMHQLILHQPTQREKQLNQMVKDPIESPLVLQPQRWNCKIMYPRYLLDSRLSRHLQGQFIK